MIRPGSNKTAWGRKRVKSREHKPSGYTGDAGVAFVGLAFPATLGAGAGADLNPNFGGGAAAG